MITAGEDHKQPMTIMKHYLVIVVVVAIAFAALLFGVPFGILTVQEAKSRVRYADVNRREFETVIRPAAKWVREFRNREGRLPTEEELNAQVKTLSTGTRWVGIFDTAPAWIHHRWQPGTDFILIGNTGEWNLYFHSWDNKEVKIWTD
jgi:hypothetical protein